MLEPLIQVKSVNKSFKCRDRQDRLVLSAIDFNVYPGEIVAILGKSGAGKSTLLRIMAGLEVPSEGEVRFKGQKVIEPIPELAMVFQNFALMPWLTVLQNVELGLEARGVPKEERRMRALAAIDIVGLDGFESAYPKELSGGMCQRAGFARAFVVDPEVLFMDEAFSALDVLTADNLRGDLLDLWQEKKTKIKTILLVTHNIEEAVLLADRILVLSSNPGMIRAELSVHLFRPRNAQQSEFRQLVDEVYTSMTAATAVMKDQPLTVGMGHKVIDLGYRLPQVDISELTGLLEAIYGEAQATKVDLPTLAAKLHLKVNDLFPLTEAAEILRFAVVSDGDITLTEAAKEFVEADILKKKKLFATHLLNYVPLARHIRQVLDHHPDHVMKEEKFLKELEDYLSEEVAEEVLTTVIDWGRYAEIFAYDYNTGMLSLENPN